MKEIPLCPRKDYVIKMAREFIVKSGINSLPIDLFALYKKYGWNILSFSQVKALEIKHSKDFGYKLNCDAKTYLRSDGRYLTIYDGAISTDGRILWTIAHEIAHIVLKHMEDFEQTAIDKGLAEEENEVLEAEANLFVSEFLAPSEVLLHCNCTTKTTIKKLCGLSKEAAENKETYLLKYKPKVAHESINEQVLRQFYDYKINKMYYHKVYINLCPNCKNYILSNKEHFCRICGKPINFRTSGHGVIYNDGFETDSTGKTVLCPICQEHKSEEDAYTCSKCGADLVNKCLSNNDECPKYQPGSSRYCYHCGSKTTFYLKGFLKSYIEHRNDFYFKSKYINDIYNDSSTGEILNGWNYVLSCIKEEGQFPLYHMLKGTIAKIDYDTLYVFTDDQRAIDALNVPANANYLMELLNNKLDIAVLEIIIQGMSYSITG